MSLDEPVKFSQFKKELFKLFSVFIYFKLLLKYSLELLELRLNLLFK